MRKTFRAWPLAALATGALLAGLSALLRAGKPDSHQSVQLLWTLGGGLCLGLLGLLALAFSRRLGALLDGDASDAASRRAAANPLTTLFLVSFLCLFLEVLLIRYASSQVRIFSFYKNIPLVSCYLGMGIGCFLRGGRSRHVLGFLLWLLPLAVGLSLGAIPAGYYLGEWAASGSTEHILGDAVVSQAQGAALASQILMGFFAVGMLAAVTSLFIALGRLLGDAFSGVPRLAAYTINILGSLAGVAAFLAVSYLWTPPWVWLIIGLLPLLWWLDRPAHQAAAAALIALNVLAVAPSFGTTVWSPYQKLVGWEDPIGKTGLRSFLVVISDVFYQVALDLRAPAIMAYGNNPYPHYDAQFANLPRGGRVLVVGAGTGNDVAAALRAGAGHVDAVDIDPAIVQMGRAHHPERPYDDPRVRVIVDDARSAFHTLPASTYDAVVFGLLDSHTQLGVSSVRLDNYVFTLESFEDARRLLKAGGRLIVTAATFREWFRERLASLLAVTCGHPVDVRKDSLSVSFSCTPSAAVDPELARLRPTLTLPTDDWPFLYLPEAEIPTAYLIVIAMLALASLLILRGHGLRLAKLGALQWHLFFLGGAFLLVEVHSINRLALLFGTTWLVSAITIALVLVLILFANLTAMAWTSVPYGLAYAGLLASLAASYLFNSQPVAGLGLAASLGYALVQLLPVYFAGLVFARSFAGASDAGAALGANLLGAVVGGWVEYASMAVGIRALVLIAAALYLGSALALLRSRKLELKESD